MNYKSIVLASARLAVVLADASASRSRAEQRRWFTMKAENGVGEVVIYGEIGKSWWDDDAMSAKQFDDELKAMGDVKTINVRINSPGGDAFDGIAIHNMLRNHKAQVNVTVDGIAASAASIIAMAGDTITMPKNAFLLIHGASAIVVGNQQDMQSMADDLKRLDASIVNTYATRSGADEKKLAAIMKEDRLMDANEAKDLGLVDEVKDAVKMAAHFPLRLLPKAAADKFKANAEVSEEAAPPPSPEGGEPEKSSDDPAPSTPTNVVQLKATAKAEGRAEYRAYVKQVNDLCSLAGFTNMAAKMIDADKSVDDVRAELVKAKAEEDERQRNINPHHTPPEAATVKTTWGKITDKINASVTGKKATAK